MSGGIPLFPLRAFMAPLYWLVYFDNLLCEVHCATSREVAGSIPDGVTEIFY
jgi:hypothetical protein